MAYRPSFRRSRVKIENLQPNLTPVMNLMVVIIPLLLSSAQYIKISVIELNLPPAAGAKTVKTDMPKETELKLDLAVTITDKGFFLSSAAGIMKTEQGPSISKVNGEYDYALLSQRLYEIKQKAVGRFRDVDSIVIQAEPQIEYQDIVSTMDASRSISIDGRHISLFPKVSFSASVL
ncbi:MAG: ExbD/TolR family protein [bacterium]